MWSWLIASQEVWTVSLMNIGEVLYRCGNSVVFLEIEKKNRGPVHGPKCRSNPCLNGAKCFMASEFEYSCQCLPGYKGRKCENKGLENDSL